MLGSLTTLLAAILTRAFRKSPIAYVWPIALNAIIVGAYLSFLTGTKASYPVFVISIGISQAGVVLLIGIPPLLGSLDRHILTRFHKGEIVLMSKIKAKPRNYLYPIPAVPVSCTDSEGV